MVWLIFPIILFSYSVDELKKDIKNSYLYKIELQKYKLSKIDLKNAQSPNYGEIVAKYNASYLFEKKSLKIDINYPIPLHQNLPISSHKNFQLQILYNYPIFSGFAITNNIKIAKLKKIKQKLALKNTFNNLFLNAINLHSKIYSISQNIKALNEAKKALKDALNTTKDLFKQGLSNKAKILVFQAKYYEIDAKIKELTALKNSLINNLYLLLNKKTPLLKIEIPKEKITLKLNNRADIKMLKKDLKIAEYIVKLAKSNLYPHIFFQAAYEKDAINSSLSKNPYQNINNSYLALSLEYKINLKNYSQIQSAKINKNITTLYFQNYYKKAKTEYKNLKLTLNSLFKQLKATNLQLKAKEEEYKIIKDKYALGLTTSTILKDAISKLAQIKAKKENLKAKIFFTFYKLKIISGD